MKGTIAILGCLFAAYAAPLFANEVPLILEETIQLPEVPDVWDVALINGNDYAWVFGAGPLYESRDSSCYFICGYASLGATDTFQTDTWAEMNGNPRSVEFVMGPSDSIRCVVTSSYHETCELAKGTCCVSVYDFARQRVIYNVDWANFCDRPWQIPGQVCLCHHSILNLAVFPAYPQAVLSLPVMRKWFSSSGEDHTPHRLSPNLLGTGASIQLSSDYALAFSSQYYDQLYFVAVQSNGTMDKLVFVGDTVEISEEWDISEPMFSSSIKMLCTWDDSSGAALVVMQTSDSLKAFTDASDYPLWRRSTSYEFATLSDVVAPSVGEELLLAESQFSLLHIYDPLTFRFWGQTSNFETGWDEIKVISRYDRDYRRLVVRYGSELRIYRFGDPILDADDARPELPSELTLTAYPNPFNPTTMIAFDLPATSQAQLVVYDLTGRAVQTLLDEQMSGGRHEFGFDGAALPSGIYFARLSAGNLVKTQKMVLLK